VNVNWGARTDVGLVREANEDSYLAEAPLFVVADGMGGHLAGDVASQTAIETIARSNDRAASPGRLASVVREANSAIYNKAGADPALRGMGTTCTLLLIDSGHGHIAHVGDSRAYLMRNGDLAQVTEDHTLVGRLVREGKLSPKEAELHPQRSIITRALGVEADVEVDTQDFELSEGDRLMLCSDGLTSMIPKEAIAKTLSDEADPQAAASRLVDMANEAGGEDNITVVIVDVGKDRSETHAARPQAAVTEAPPAREDTPAEPAPGPPPPSPSRRGHTVRKILVAALILALLVGGGVAAGRYALANSWFVGSTTDGDIAIFNGIPEEVLGLTFAEEHEQTDLTLDELPPFRRENVENGIKADSLLDARRIVSDLRSLAEDVEFGDRNRRPRNQRNQQD
jgi:PPM family protein phosphatase